MKSNISDSNPLIANRSRSNSHRQIGNLDQDMDSSFNSEATKPAAVLTPTPSPSPSVTTSPNPQLDADAWVRAARPGDENHQLWLERFGSLHSHPRRMKSNASHLGAASSSIGKAASSSIASTSSTISPSRVRSESVGGSLSRNHKPGINVGLEEREVRRRASALDGSRATLGGAGASSSNRGGREGNSASSSISTARAPSTPGGFLTMNGNEEESQDEDYGVVGFPETAGGASQLQPPNRRERKQHQEPSEHLLSPEVIEAKQARRSARREKRKLKGKGKELPMPILPPRNSSTITSIATSTSNQQYLPASPTHLSQGPSSPSSSHQILLGAGNSELPATPTFSNFSHSHSNSQSTSTGGHGGLTLGGTGSSSYASAPSSMGHARASSNGSIPINKYQQSNSTTFPTSSTSTSTNPDLETLVPHQPLSPSQVTSSTSSSNRKLSSTDPSTPSRASFSVSRNVGSNPMSSSISTRTSSIVGGTPPTPESLLPKHNPGEGDVPHLPSRSPTSGGTVKRSLDLVLSKARFGLGGKDKEKEKRSNHGLLEKESIPDPEERGDQEVEAIQKEKVAEPESLQEGGEAAVKPSRPTPPTPSPSSPQPQPALLEPPTTSYPSSSVASRAPTVPGGRPLSRVWESRSKKRVSTGLAGEETEDGDEFYDAKSDEGDEGEWSDDERRGGESSSRARRESGSRGGKDLAKRRSRKAGIKQDREKSSVIGSGEVSQTNPSFNHSHARESSAQSTSRSRPERMDPLGSPTDELPAWDQRESSDPLRAERELMARAKAMREAQRQSIAEEKAMLAAEEVASQGSSKQLEAAEQAYIEFMLGEAEAERLAMEEVDPSLLTEQEKAEAALAEHEVLRLFGGEGNLDLKAAEQLQLTSPLAQESIESSKPTSIQQQQTNSSELNRPTLNINLSPLVGSSSPSSNPNTQSSSPISVSTDQDRRRNLMEQNTFFIPSIKNKGSVKSLASMSIHSQSRPASRGKEDTSPSIPQTSFRSSSGGNRASARSGTVMAGLLKKMKNSPAIIKLSKNAETSQNGRQRLQELPFSNPNSLVEELQETQPRKSSSFGSGWSRSISKASPNQDFPPSSNPSLNGLGIVEDGTNSLKSSIGEERDLPRASTNGGWRARVQSLSSQKAGRTASSSTPPPPSPSTSKPIGPKALPPRPATAGSELPESSNEPSWRWNLLNEAVGRSLGGGRSPAGTTSRSPKQERTGPRDPTSKEIADNVRTKRKERRQGDASLSLPTTPSISEQQNVTIRKTLSPRILTEESHEADRLVEDEISDSEAEEELKDVEPRPHGEPIEPIHEAEEISTDDQSGSETNLSSSRKRGIESPALKVSRPFVDQSSRSNAREEQHRALTASEISPSQRSQAARFQDDTSTSPFLGDQEERLSSSEVGRNSTSSSTSPSTQKLNATPAFFLKSPSAEIRKSFSTDSKLNRSPVIPSPSPKVGSGLFGALKTKVSGKSSPYGLRSGVSSFDSFPTSHQHPQSSGLAAVEEATRLLQTHTEAMTPSPMPSPMPGSSFQEQQASHSGISQSISNGQAVGLGLGPAWENGQPSGVVTSSSSSSSFGKSGTELRAFDDMLRGFGQADKALLKDIAARSKDSPLQTQLPTISPRRELLDSSSTNSEWER